MKVIVLTKVHEIKCPHCGKKIYLVISEGEVKEKVEVPKPPEVSKIQLPEVKVETPMEAKKRFFEWLTSLPEGTTFSIGDIRKALNIKGFEGSIRGFGRILHSLVKDGYLKIVNVERGETGGKRHVYKVIRKVRI